MTISRKEMAKRILICEQPDGSYVLASPEQIKQALADEKRLNRIGNQIKKLEDQLELIQSDCKHEVTYDEEGFPYNIRHCLRCGHTSLL
jgi:predicted Rossmann fold nucleotide-binding protein DprA/Smf involved in DNA uptake